MRKEESSLNKYHLKHLPSYPPIAGFRLVTLWSGVRILSLQLNHLISKFSAWVMITCSL